MQNLNLFFTNFQSVGDVLFSIPIIENILKNNENVNILYCTFKDHGYLLEHLPLKLKLIDFDYRIKSGQNIWYENAYKFCPDDYYHFNIDYGGSTYYSKINFLNSEFVKKKLNVNLPIDENYFIELPEVSLDVKAKSIYVETGIPYSRDKVNILNIDTYSLFFPTINFYTTSSTNINRKNIIDCSNKNIIELANISKKCCAIIGHGSGPFLCTHNKANKDKFKYIYKEDIREWDHENSNIINVFDDDVIIKFLRSIR